MKKDKKYINIITIFVVLSLVALTVLEYINPVVSLLFFVAYIGLFYGLYVSMNKSSEKPFVDQNYVIEKENQKEKKECPVCHTENIINRKYCKKCNTPIQNIECPVCKKKNLFTNKYCEECDSILQNRNRH